MSAQHHIGGEKRAALHCEALLARQTPEHDLLGSFAAFGEELAARFATELYAVIGGTPPQHSISQAEKVFTGALEGSIGPVAGNLLIPVAGPGGRLLASFALAPLMEQMERMFGGASGGAPAATLSKLLPRSVELLIRRLEKGLCAALSNCLAAEHRHSIGTPRLDPSLRALSPFPEGAEVAVLTLDFTADNAAPISLKLACRLATLARLVPMRAASDAALAPQRTMLSAPFTDIPLPLRAVLVDMIMPVRRLAALEVGMVLPLAVARSVPLKAGAHTLAFGTVGEMDDRNALQIESVQIERTLIGGEIQ